MTTKIAPISTLEPNKQLEQFQKMYSDLIQKYDQLKAENELFKQSAPIVGVRWYGHGGFGIGLNFMVNGVNKIALEGYGAKAVIDYSSWLRVRTTEEARNGILVRDDLVIDELGLTNKLGAIGQKDKFTNPNSFTDQEIEKILKGNISNLKKIVNEFTAHFAARHFLYVAKQIGFTDEAKLFVIREVYFELFVRFKNSLLLKHDLALACELEGVTGFENMTEDEMIEELTRIELKRTDKSFIDEL